MTTIPDYEELLTALKEVLVSLREDEEPNQLVGVTPDVAFELGFAAAISEVRRFREAVEEL